VSVRFSSDCVPVTTNVALLFVSSRSLLSDPIGQCSRTLASRKISDHIMDHRCCAARNVGMGAPHSGKEQ
jgi:hypothetical protein